MTIFHRYYFLPWGTSWRKAQKHPSDRWQQYYSSGVIGMRISPGKSSCEMLQLSITVVYSSILLMWIKLVQDDYDTLRADITHWNVALDIYDRWISPLFSDQLLCTISIHIQWEELLYKLLWPKTPWSMLKVTVGSNLCSIPGFLLSTIWRDQFFFTKRR